MSVVYMLGAGASHASVGTPLGPDLVWNYHEDCFQLSEIFGDAAIETGPSFDNYRKFLVLMEKEFPELSGIVEKWDKKGISFYYPPPLQKRHYVDELLQLLRSNRERQSMTLVRQLTFEHIARSGMDGANDLYQRFKADVLAKIPNGEVSIVSFNFDSYLNEAPPGVTFDYRLDFHWREPNRLHYCSSPVAIPLIKLNGSFDWGICSQAGHLNLLHYFLRGDFYRHAKCNITSCQGVLEPLVILPYTDPSSKLSKLWAVAEEHLAKVERVIIIGYSFPPYDNKVTELLQRCLRSGTKLEIIDKVSPEDRNETGAKNRLRTKYKTLLPDVNLDDNCITVGGFEEFLSNETKRKE